MDYWAIIVLVTGMSFIIKMGFSLNQWFRDDIAPDGFTRVDKPNYTHIEMLERELFPEWFPPELPKSYIDRPYGPRGETGPRGIDAIVTGSAPVNPKHGDIWLSPNEHRQLNVRPAKYDVIEQRRSQRQWRGSAKWTASANDIVEEINKANTINSALKYGGYVPQAGEYVTYDGTGRVVQIYDLQTDEWTPKFVARPRALAEPEVVWK